MRRGLKSQSPTGAADMSVFNVVSQDVSRNPVTRAVQKRVLAKAIRDFQLRIFTLNEGEDCRVDVGVASAVIRYSWHLKMQTNSVGMPASDVLWGALCALMGMEGKWVKSAAELIDDALSLSLRIMDRATADQATRAWAAVRRLEEAE